MQHCLPHTAALHMPACDAVLRLRGNSFTSSSLRANLCTSRASLCCGHLLSCRQMVKMWLPNAHSCVTKSNVIAHCQPALATILRILSGVHFYSQLPNSNSPVNWLTHADIEASSAAALPRYTAVSVSCVTALLLPLTS